MEVVEWRRAGLRPFPFCLISIRFDGQFPAHVVEWRGAGIWASECWCDSTEWCVNVAPATADGVRTLSFRFFFVFNGTNLLVSDAPRRLSWIRVLFIIRPSTATNSTTRQIWNKKHNNKIQSEEQERRHSPVDRRNSPSSSSDWNFYLFPTSSTPSIVGVQLVDRPSLPSFSSSSSSVSSSGLAYPSHQPTQSIPHPPHIGRNWKRLTDARTYSRNFWDFKCQKNKNWVKEENSEYHFLCNSPVIQ